MGAYPSVGSFKAFELLARIDFARSGSGVATHIDVCVGTTPSFTHRIGDGEYAGYPSRPSQVGVTSKLAFGGYFVTMDPASFVPRSSERRSSAKARTSPLANLICPAPAMREDFLASSGVVGQTVSASFR